MVSADSINYDVWEHIFAYLSTPDLASAAAVSRSLWTSALPFLYRTLHFHYSQLIVYPRVASPFAILRNRPFAAFTRNVDIRVIPQTSAGKKNSLDSGFLMDAHVAITSMPNLCSFTCTVSSAIPSFLIPLQSKNLQYLHINAGLTAAQASELVKIEHLKTLVLDHAKSPVLNALPEWAERLKPTLRHLTIRSSPLLNRHVLSMTLDKLPKLLGLHVLSCPLVSHAEILALIGSAPKLQSLACTVIDYASSIPETSLTGLKHLALDFSSSRRLPPPPLSASSQEDRPHPLSDILSLTHSLQSLVIQNAEPFNDDVLETLASDHYTLRYLAILGTPIDADSMSDIIAQCNDLERLSVPIPKDDEEFVYALAMSYSLHTLIDASVNGTHSHGVSLTTSSVVDIMEAVEPLRRVVSQNRLWTAHYGPQGKQVKFQRLKRAVNSDLWFMPPPEAGVEDCQSQF